MGTVHPQDAMFDEVKPGSTLRRGTHVINRGMNECTR